MQAQNHRVLCVDDEPSNLKLLAATLEPRGYEVIKAASGREALEKIDHEKVDLVLLDVMMTGMSGFEVCRKIKEDEKHRNIPIVMITALRSKEDRIKGIEAGAEDFISKPFDQTEVLARIKMLLRIRDLNGRLSSAYSRITDLTGFGEDMAMSFNPLHFNFISKFDSIVRHVIRKSADPADDRPQTVILGFIDEHNAWQWYRFEPASSSVHRTWLKVAVHDCLSFAGERGDGGLQAYLFNETEMRGPGLLPFIKAMESLGITVSNFVCVSSNVFCIFTLNYNREVTTYDAEVLNSIAMQSLFLKSLAVQVKETENAFDYLVLALSRAAEVNDEDTGNHIIRVGEYCAELSKRLGMQENFINIIRIQARMHDVGKIHTPAHILKKPGKLTPEEFEEMKKHTVYGAKILGDHVRLTMAKEIALAHHERWDGRGYPRGLRGEQIPFTGRILNIADQYDALRNKRVYKAAFDHETTHRIITEGDGRTLPGHFDPGVLRAYKEAHRFFEEIYERFKG